MCMVLYNYTLIPDYSYLFIKVPGHIFLATTYFLILTRINNGENVADIYQGFTIISRPRSIKYYDFCLTSSLC